MHRRRFCSSLGATLAVTASPALAAADDGPLVGPIQLVGSRVVMPVSIGNAGTFLFAIDTGGAFSLIREDLARHLSLPDGGPHN
ncbi:MAG: signaling protein, partial [Gluconacetobacter liquefaciens]